MQRSNPCFVGIDIGTSTIKCLMATVDQNSPEPLVLAIAERPSAGMRKGVILHPQEVTRVLEEVLADAERQSGLPVHGATVNINGAHIQSEASRGVVAISGVGHKITDADRDRAEEAATVIRMPANRDIIQVFAKNYRIDGQETVKDPVGMQGVRLEVDTQIVTGATPPLHNLETVFSDLNLVMHNRTTSALAAAEAVLDRNQKESGTAVVDIGGGTTNVVVIEEGEIQYVGVLPIGGQHITNDLAIGLKTDLDIAERVKVEHAKTVDVPDLPSGDVGISHNGESYTFSSDDIYMIVTARIEELLELIDKELKKIHRSRKLPGGIVFVGGSSKLPGLEQTAKRVLELPARIGVIQNLGGGLKQELKEGEHAAVVGLMMLDMLLAPTMGGQKSRKMPSLKAGDINTKVSSLLKGVFRKK